MLRSEHAPAGLLLLAMAPPAANAGRRPDAGDPAQAGQPQAVGVVHTLRVIPEACARLEGQFTGSRGNAVQVRRGAHQRALPGARPLVDAGERQGLGGQRLDVQRCDPRAERGVPVAAGGGAGLAQGRQGRAADAGRAGPLADLPEGSMERGRHQGKLAAVPMYRRGQWRWKARPANSAGACPSRQSGIRHQLQAAAGARLDPHDPLAATEVPGHQFDQLGVGLAIDRR